MVMTRMIEEPEMETAPLLSKPTYPLSYLFHDEMITRPLLEWHDGLEAHREVFGDWFVTKIEHMKSFHFSSVMHEYLRVTVVQKNVESQEPRDSHYLFVERMVDKDEATVGWKWVQHPELVGWWIIRLLLGYSTGKQGGGVEALASSSAVDHWRAAGYSGSDYLCHLDFAEPGVPLLEFAHVLIRSSKSAPQYNIKDANCFWFAFTVYETLKEEWRGAEFRGGYYKHRGKFAGLRILPSNPFSTSSATGDIKRFKKKAEEGQAVKELKAMEREKAYNRL